MVEEDSILDNIEIHKGFAIISINPKLYPLSVIYSAAYWLLDRVHVIIDGDPDTEILVEIRPKKDAKEIDLKEIGYEFNDELINYSVYTIQATRNKRLREVIIEHALAGNIKGQQSFNPRPQANLNQNQQCNINSPQSGKQIASNWKPGEQPLENDQLETVKQRSEPTKNDSLFKGVPGIDTEGITNVKDYRHRSEDFDKID